MCTATWWGGHEGYALRFNRDEQKRRARALPPQCIEVDGMAVLAPSDPDGGGTWIAVNACGLSLALLNYYEATPPEPPAQVRSRGLLVRELSALCDVKAIEKALCVQKLAIYRPFYLLAMERGRKVPACFRWDGFDLCGPYEPQVPLTTSSCQTEAVVVARCMFYAEHCERQEAEPEVFEAYHQWRDPERSETSVCMERTDARTVSFTHLEVGSDEAVMHYRERLPGEGEGFGEAVVSVLKLKELV